VKSHLLVHVWPVKTSSEWQRLLRMLAERWDQFDGKKVVAVVTSAEPVVVTEDITVETADPQEVADELPPDAEIEIYDNDPQLREVVTWRPLVRAVVDQPGRTFYCHAKGVTHTHQQACYESVRLWVDVMTHVCLDWPKLLDAAMEEHHMAGCFRRPQCYFSGVQQVVPWHYSGTFFWFDNEAVRSRDWEEIDQNSHGVEIWPSRHFTRKETACLFEQGDRNPYDLPYWRERVWPLFESWREAMTSIGMSTTGRSMPDWSLKLRRNFRTSLGRGGSSTTALASESSRLIRQYHPYVLPFLPSCSFFAPRD